VLITGASSGIGEATARELGNRGYKVILTARRLNRLKTIAKEIRANGGEAEAYELDLQSSNSIQSLVDSLCEMNQPPHCEIHNAGYGIYGRVDQVPVEEARDLFETNLFGAMELIRRSVDWMKNQENARIVTVASAVAKRGFPVMSYYSASKAALESMSESMRLELEPYDITVQIVYPVRTTTEFSDSARRWVDEPFEFPSHGPTQTSKEVAKSIAEGLQSNKFRIHPHYSTKILGTLNEWFPGLVSQLTRLKSVVRETFSTEEVS